MRNQVFVCHTDSVQGGMLSIQLKRSQPANVNDDQRCRCPALPTGCLVEIFRHLDCHRSLMRCTAVCKDWRRAAADATLHTRLRLRPDSRPHSRQRSMRSAEASAILQRLSKVELVDLELGTGPSRDSYDHISSGHSQSLPFTCSTTVCTLMPIHPVLLPPARCPDAHLSRWPQPAQIGLQHLTSLSLADDACLGMVSDVFASRLAALPAPHCSLKHNAAPGTTTPKLPNLAHLSFTCHSATPSFSDGAVSAWLQNAPDLRSLEFFGCSSLTGVTLIKVATYAPLLEQFAFVHYSEVAGSWGAQEFLLMKGKRLKRMTLHSTLARGLEGSLTGAALVGCDTRRPVTLMWRRPDVHEVLLDVALPGTPEVAITFVPGM
eukprot:jgi/Ulvmu1/11620/UM008_0022.1